MINRRCSRLHAHACLYICNLYLETLKLWTRFSVDQTNWHLQSGCEVTFGIRLNSIHTKQYGSYCAKSGDVKGAKRRIIDGNSFPYIFALTNKSGHLKKSRVVRKSPNSQRGLGRSSTGDSSESGKLTSSSARLRKDFVCSHSGEEHVGIFWQTDLPFLLMKTKLRRPWESGTDHTRYGWRAVWKIYDDWGSASWAVGMEPRNDSKWAESISSARIRIDPALAWSHAWQDAKNPVKK